MTHHRTDKMDGLGISRDGVSLALAVKNAYRHHEPLCVPGHEDRILIPELLLNQHLDLSGFEDPLPLALVATRDPESPMALAATARLGPKAAIEGRRLVAEVFNMVGKTTRHPGVKSCVDLVTENDFRPEAMAAVRHKASQIIVQTRQQYTSALRQNLRAMLEGVIDPRLFVKEFFQLTEQGNLRHDIRGKLISSLLVSDTVRPSIKFLFLENFLRMPTPTRCAVITALLRAKSSPQIQVIKEELKWIVRQDRVSSPGAKPAPKPSAQSAA